MNALRSKPKSGHHVETSFSMKCYFKEINQYALLSREEELELGTRIQKDRDPEALEKLINANLRLVVKIANDYSRFGLAVEDLISEGNIGLMKAAEKFDPTFGVKFSTYGSWWIKQSIKRALGNQSRTIRLPLHVLQQLRDLDQAEQELVADPLAADKPGRVEGFTPKKIAQLRRVSQPVISLDEHGSSDGAECLDISSMIPDTAAENPAEVAGDADMFRNLTEVLSVLNPRERKIIACRFGLNQRNQQTLEELGVKFGVSRERIRQIQKAAIDKLRSAMKRLEPSAAKKSHAPRLSRKIAQFSPQPEAIPA